MPPTDLVESRLTVMTWNLWWRYGPWEERLPAIRATVAAVRPDVLALQEVWDDGEANLAELLAEDLGHHCAFESRDERERGVRFGNAVVSRWPIAERRAQPLPDAGEPPEHRLALHAAVAGPRGRLDVFCTHLNYRFEHSHVRQAQVREIARFIGERAANEVPPILCGDFNAMPGSDEMRMLVGLARPAAPGLVLRDAWATAGDGGPGHTWDNRNPFAAAELEPDARIDYVLAGPPGPRGVGHVTACRLAGNAPVGGTWPSDHFAVVAELRY